MRGGMNVEPTQTHRPDCVHSSPVSGEFSAVQHIGVLHPFDHPIPLHRLFVPVSLIERNQPVLEKNGSLDVHNLPHLHL